MVGAERKCSPTTPDFTQQYTLSSRRLAHRPTVEGSGQRDCSLHCGRRLLLDGVTDGDPLAGLFAAMQAIVRNRLFQPIGQDREGFLARPANPAPHPNIFVSIIVCLSKPSSVADDRVVLASWASPWKKSQQTGLPRLEADFRLRQCDKERHDWREAPAADPACKQA